jgi:RNA-binding protein YhbY
MADHLCQFKSSKFETEFETKFESSRQSLRADNMNEACIGADSMTEACMRHVMKPLPGRKGGKCRKVDSMHEARTEALAESIDSMSEARTVVKIGKVGEYTA